MQQQKIRVAIPGFLSLDKIFNQLVSFVKNDSKLLENHTHHSGTYLYGPDMAVPPRPRGYVYASPSKSSSLATHGYNERLIPDNTLFNCDGRHKRTH